MQFPSLNILHQTSTIADGNMSFRFGEHDEVVINRKKFLERNGIDFKNHICMACNHGELITTVNRSSRGVGAMTQEEMIEAEVLVTKEKGLALMLLTADCIPGIFYDPVNEVIALAHLNRKTIAHSLGQKTVRFLTEKYGSNPKDLLVYFGPHIKKESYRFLLPLTQPTPKQLKNHIEERDGHAYIDMVSAELSELKNVGITKYKVTISQIDTATSEKHFSHYETQKKHSKAEGRLATIALMCV